MSERMNRDRSIDGAVSLEIDPYGEEFLGDPYAFHTELRDAGPVVYLPKYDVVVLARYEDVRTALEDPGTYCSRRGVGLSDFHLEEPWRLPSIILEADAPLHTKTRKVLNEALSRSALAALGKRTYRWHQGSRRSVSVVGLP